MYKTIFFDLDGTITDSSEGIIAGFRHTFGQFGMQVPPMDTLLKYIGPPLDASFAQHFAPQDVAAAVQAFKDYYVPVGLYQNTVYEGVVDMLCRLKEGGYRVYLATAKGERSAKLLLARAGLDGYFDRIYGAFLEKGIKNKTDVLARLFDLEPDLKRAQCLLVGDTAHDAEGAQNAGIDFAAVTYGFGKLADFADYSVKFLAKSPQDVADNLLK